MRLDELKPAPGSHRKRKRIGRGISAGQGKTAGRGQKGQGSRSSVNIPQSFEGGQMPLAQRLPKLRGFDNFNRKEYVEVNVAKLNRFEAGTEVNPELLAEVGLVKGRNDGIKILAAGQITVALKVSAHRVSASAKAAIEAAGGSVELLGPQPSTPEERAAKAKARAKKGSAKKAAAAERAEAAAEADDAKEQAKAESDATAKAEAKAEYESRGEAKSDEGEPAEAPAEAAAERPADDEAKATDTDEATDADEADSPDKS
jgi:large subunit ribosomal protein L15